MNRRNFITASASAVLLSCSETGSAATLAGKPDGASSQDKIAMDTSTQKPAVDLSNWRFSPQNHSAFHHLPPEIATARIASGGTATFEFERSSKSLDGFVLRLPTGATLGLDHFLEATSTDAMIVLHDGALVYKTHRNGMDPTSRHIAMSATKAVVGLLAETVATDGAIDLQAPVTKYVPEIAKSPYAGATVRHLLDMRVGVVLDGAQEKAYARSNGWEPPGDEKGGMQSFFSNLKGPAAEHGGPFRYHSAHFDLLGWVLERATSDSVQNLLSKKIWTQIGAADDAALTLDWMGLGRSAGGLCVTIGDLARLGYLVSLDGRSCQRQVLPEHIVNDLAKDGDRQAWTSGQWGESFAPISRHISYRSGWYTVDDEPQILFAMGVHGQNVFVDRKRKIVVAKFSSWAQPVDGRTMWLTHAAVSEIARCLSAV